MLWKKVFHGVEKFYGATGLRGGGGGGGGGLFVGGGGFLEGFGEEEE